MSRWAPRKLIPMSDIAQSYITRSEQMTDQSSESKDPRDELKDPKEQSTLRDAFANLLNPVPLVSLAMLLGVMFLLVMAIFGWDRGHVLFTMAQPDFARGLITYLFTIVTIGTAVVLIISGLTVGNKEQFDRGKEILGLLLGVFGTMVGFYFGSEVSHVKAKLTLVPPILSASEIVSGEKLQVTALVQGGSPPYRMGITQGDSPPTSYDQAPRGDGWILTSINASDVNTDTTMTLWIGIQDGAGDIVTTKSNFLDKPKPK
jgi:hypothetical protein